MKKVGLFILSLTIILGVPAFAAAKAVTFSAESGQPGDTITVSINVDNMETNTIMDS